jgi:hypothetical protein
MEASSIPPSEQSSKQLGYEVVLFRASQLFSDLAVDTIAVIISNVTMHCHMIYAYDMQRARSIESLTQIYIQARF